MALRPSGNPISFLDITKEFGLPPSRNLGAYRISQTVGNLTRPLDDGIPTSGQIKFSDFYSKSLNVIVYCKGERIIARSRYNDNDDVTVIGGFKTRPTSSSGTKVWIHTNETISSNIPASFAPNRRYCSLRTGSGWNDNTDLRLDIGTSGLVTGAGGDGGDGGPAGANDGAGGKSGTSAIGVNYQPITITNRGKIQGGTGGGSGGGGGDIRDVDRYSRTAYSLVGGGGGGGGLGSPAGAGGKGGASPPKGGKRSVTDPGDAGTNGSLNSGGRGGTGGRVAHPRAHGQGGNGGGHEENGTAAFMVWGDRGERVGRGGSAGASGYGIIITNNGTGVSISGNARIGGDVYNTTVS